MTTSMPLTVNAALVLSGVLQTPGASDLTLAPGSSKVLLGTSSQTGVYTITRPGIVAAAASDIRIVGQGTTASFLAGSVYVDAGQGTGFAGSLYLGVTSAAVTTLGFSGSTTTLASGTTQVQGNISFAATSQILLSSGNTLQFGPDTSAQFILSRSARLTANSNGGDLVIQGGLGNGSGTNGNVYVGASGYATPQVTLQGAVAGVTASTVVNISAPTIVLGNSSTTTQVAGGVSFFSSSCFVCFHSAFCILRRRHSKFNNQTELCSRVFLWWADRMCSRRTSAN